MCKKQNKFLYNIIQEPREKNHHNLIDYSLKISKSFILIIQEPKCFNKSAFDFSKIVSLKIFLN